MHGVTFFELVGFGGQGWGATLSMGALVAISVAFAGFLLGTAIGGVLAWTKVAGRPIGGIAASAYTTVMRSVPDLLVIYFVFYGSSSLLTFIGQLVRDGGNIVLPAFAAGSIAIGLSSAAHQAEVFRGAYRAIPQGQIDAALAFGMTRLHLFRRIVAPRVLATAIPALGNVWQLAITQSSLVSVIGVAEIMRQAQVGAGSTRQPFAFYFAAAGLYLLIAGISAIGLGHAYRRLRKGEVSP